MVRRAQALARPLCVAHKIVMGRRAAAASLVVEVMLVVCSMGTSNHQLFEDYWMEVENGSLDIQYLL